MRIFAIAFAVIAAASAASISSDYLPPVGDNNLPSQEYIPPSKAAAVATEEQTVVTNDGYRYKTVRRLRLRHRRDVAQEYLPPAEESVAAEEFPEEKTVVDSDGYRYKTVRRLKYRHRRDVNELPTNEYLPPAEKSAEAADAVAVEAPVEAPQESAALAKDGYRYKTVRRLKYRHRRDVNELASSEYLPPAEKSAESADAVAVEAPVEAPQESAALAEDGYRYKTIRRLKYRHRRDVNELASSEYLPPAEKTAESADTVTVEAPVEALQESAALAKDGYRYKTVRRLKYRHRRDVNELASSEYLPPAEKAAESTDTVAVEAPVEAPQESAALAEDGYRYKTVRRLKYRHRRDVNELASSEYLPPAEKAAESTDSVAVEAPVEAPQESAALAEDGYRYKTVRRLKYRHRRDVNELASSEYLPPAEKSAESADAVAVEAPVEAPQESAALAADGYRYKTVRRLKYRHRRDVNELASSEYLPPAEKSAESVDTVALEAPVEAPQESAALSEDGYRYKTVRRLKYRHRRDVNELASSEYLPPAEKSAESVDTVAVEAPVEALQESAALSEDGYRYKTVRRLKYRHRRDVNELASSEYLPPAEKSAESVDTVAVEAPVEAPQESAALSEDGYRYKTVRRLKYRHRRDVNELASSEYLPPVEKSAELSVEEIPAAAEESADQEIAVQNPEETAVLANDGYRYKVVRRLKYRHRQ